MWQEYAPESGIRLNPGIQRHLACLLDSDRSKIEPANTLLFTLPGTLIIHHGNEIGMRDSIRLDNRDSMRWNDRRDADLPETLERFLHAQLLMSLQRFLTAPKVTAHWGFVEK